MAAKVKATENKKVNKILQITLCRDLVRGVNCKHLQLCIYYCSTAFI